MKQDKLYILQVALLDNKKIWRRIEIRGSQSLEVLHEEIFEAFDRYDPHLYSFYLTPPGSTAMNRFALAEEYTHAAMLKDGFAPSDKKLHDAAKTSIADLQLEQGEVFEYLFDFGDEWLHVITVEKILDVFPKKKYPLVTEKKGESPPQYPDRDDQEDLYEFDDEAIERQRMDNQKLLEAFRNYLKEKNLSDKTVAKHTSNIDFFINEFLVYEEIIPPEKGIEEINYFLGSWFIRKALWASVPQIKAMITGFKHFYTFLALQGSISDEELREMKQEIKECKSTWFEEMQEYDDAASDYW